jgi:phage-related holin
MRPLVVKGIAGTILAMLAVACGSIPAMVTELAIVVTIFVSLDTITGIIKAVADREVSSHTLKMRLVIKAAQYALLLGLAGGVAILAHSWMPVAAAMSALVSIESISMLENLVAMQDCGGVNLGPIRPLINWLAHYLQAGSKAELPGPASEGKDDVQRDLRLDIPPCVAAERCDGDKAGGQDKAGPSPHPRC